MLFRSTGYQEASRTIWDANITNLIAAVIMIIFGSGPIKGFAVVLTIGIATSVFTAVTVTRLMVSRWLRAKRTEIGRASCRERVWQSVEITVVAGVLKKKSNEPK